MDTFWKIVIEIGILGFFALLYYLFQRKKILQFSSDEIFFHLDELIYNIHERIDFLKSQGQTVESFQTYIDKLERIRKATDIEKLQVFLQIHQLPDEDSKLKRSLKDLSLMIENR